MHPLLEAIHAADLHATEKLCRAHPEWLVGEHGFRPLHLAAEKGHVEILACLLDHGADPNVAGHFGRESAYTGLLRPLHAAASNGHAAAVKLLLARGADIHGGNRYMTPLLHAADAGHHDIAELLHKGGSRRDIFAAAALGDFTRVRKLVHADPTRAKRRTELGVSALMIAASHGRLAIAETLLAAGADPRAFDARSNHVLDYAAGIGHYDPARTGDAGQAKVAGLLIARGADPNSKNWRGVRPLHHAARTARVEVARVLLDHGAEVDAHDVTGETPLRRAVVNPMELKMAELLIRHGANVNARDKRGRRVVAAARGAAMKAMLKKHGAR